MHRITNFELITAETRQRLLIFTSPIRRITESNVVTLSSVAGAGRGGEMQMGGGGHPADRIGLERGTPSH